MWTRTSQWITTVNDRHGQPGIDILSRFLDIAEASWRRGLGEVWRQTASNRQALNDVGPTRGHAA